MSNRIVRVDGLTKTEKKLKALAEGTFLSLWSYAGVFRDQGTANSTRDGKEVCDLLVVFDPHVIIFSDKDCRFQDTGDLRLRWKRWFRRAILSSADQVWGAERWVREFPDRLFLDRRCSKRFPFPLPPNERAVFHRVVVAHDGARACRETLGGSGSLMIMPSQPADGSGMPFAVGDLDPTKGFVHVFDDTSLAVIMSTLDTIADFVQYLERKARFVRSGKLGSAAGEEELLAWYLRHVDAQREHDFILPQNARNADEIVIDEGHWEHFSKSPQRLAQLREDEISYSWDALIETFNRHILDGTAESPTGSDVRHHEELVRLLAGANRTRRRILAKAFLGLIRDTPPSSQAARILRPSDPSEPYYVFVLLPPHPDRSYTEYRVVRQNLLKAYCMAVKLEFQEEAKSVIGIATESGTSQARSEEIIHYDTGDSWTDAEEKEARRLREGLGILKAVKIFSIHEDEYPLAPVAIARHRTFSAGRNDPCPCNSGKKFKKCCGSPVRRNL